MTPQTFTIGSGETRSDIVTGAPVAQLPKRFRTLAVRGSRVAIFSDRAVAKRVGQSLRAGLEREGYRAELVVVPSGERSKSLQYATHLYRTLARKAFERRSWIVALGGGVVGDLSGFVASTYLRGIPFIQIPTTLLAQVDASIGGKTGVDIPEGKNLVGAFYQPRWVWIDPSLLKSLPLEHWRNGLGEVIKYGAIRDLALFESLETKIDRLVRGYCVDWESIIARCAQIKAEVVHRDPRETRGLRALLNFGHSVGHAIEAATNYRGYHHGEAISIGMAVAAQISQQRRLLDPVGRIRLSALLNRAGLPVRPRKALSRESIMRYLSRDKKVENGSVRFVLLKGLGKAVSGQTVEAPVLDLALTATGL